MTHEDQQVTINAAVQAERGRAMAIMGLPTASGGRYALAVECVKTGMSVEASEQLLGCAPEAAGEQFHPFTGASWDKAFAGRH